MATTTTTTIKKFNIKKKKNINKHNIKQNMRSTFKKYCKKK